MLPFARRHQGRQRGDRARPPGLPPCVVLTGGPGGGKSTLLEELAREPPFAGRFVALPEAVQCARFLTVSPEEKLFQRAVVHLQMALEDALSEALAGDVRRVIICHRGSLDPLAFWTLRGWDPDEFFRYSGFDRREHYRRYAAVIHLVTAADGAVSDYMRWPRAHRPEDAEEATYLDRQLHEAWRGHPAYYRVGNESADWPAKAGRAKGILAQALDWG